MIPVGAFDPRSINTPSTHIRAMGAKIISGGYQGGGVL